LPNLGALYLLSEHGPADAAGAADYPRAGAAAVRLQVTVTPTPIILELDLEDNAGTTELQAAIAKHMALVRPFSETPSYTYTVWLVKP
jgi:hypothetical protein